MLEDDICVYAQRSHHLQMDGQNVRSVDEKSASEGQGLEPAPPGSSGMFHSQSGF